MKPLPHIAISASAGSGKTFQLAHRYIALLARGVTADRIVALTFSRKAAGEIFDAVVEHLRNAAASPAQAKRAAARVAMPNLREADFRRMLRELLDLLARVHVGTIDSFAVGIVRAFPMELGVASAPEIMDNEGATAQAVQRDVLRCILGGRGAPAAAKRSFFEAFKQATFGREEKDLERHLVAFIRGYLKWYRLLPDAERWGREDLIWPKGRRWPGGVRNAQALSDELLDLLEGVQLDAVLRTSIQRFAAFAGGYTPTSVWDSQALESKFGSVLLAGIGDLEKGELVIPYNRRRYALPPRACEILLGLLHHVLGIEMDRCLQETRGLYHVLRHYEGVYDERMLARGRLTFDDIYHLLAPGRGDLSRLNIDYRLDSRLDHWLLDEFQDTSDLQWAALGNLADEVLQDTAGTRSFFYVGDIKQAIYGWRGGNARLFDQLARRYGDRIERHPLHASYRSCPQVIDAVNRVFSGLPDGLPPEAEKRWKSAWAKHETAADHVPGSGYVALVEPRATDEGKPKAADRYRAVAGLLKEIRPLDRGLTVAVLVRTNDAARDVVQQLRAECPGLTVVHEGVASLCDNAVVSLLLSLVQFAAHPGDTMAWRHVQMSPLGEGADRDALSPATLREIQEEGFAAVFRRAGDTLAERGALDDYGRLRLGDLVEAAGAFDRQGSRDVNGFLDFMEGYTRKELASSSAVRVMTVHQAKGLGFDVVLLPDLNDESMVKAKDFDFRVERDDATGAARWALRMPRKLVAEQDPVLADQLRKADAEDSFASLCVLYVAMTRAARALYLVTSFPGKDAKTQSPAAYVKARLAGAASSMELGGETFDVLFEQGDRAWFRDVKAGDAREAKSRPARKKSPRAARAVRRRLLDVSPSRRAEHTRSGDLVFAAQTHRSLGIGSALHALFEKVGWLEETDVDAAVAAWEAGADLSPEDQAVVLRQFRACLANDAIRAALARPSPGAALWREKRFDVVLGDEWVTGSFDRVIVEEGRAVVLDFKSNDIESEDHLKQVAEGYAPQMALYRRAVARLLGWNESQVACSLVFTAVGRVVAL